MVKRILIVIVALVVLLHFQVRGAESETLPVEASIGTSAQSAILIEASTGKVLYEQNPDEKLSMASTTKIMTALLTVETGELDREIIVTDEMVQVEGTSMGLLPGDTVTLEALVYGMMLPSGNDAATAAAYAIDGTLEAFAERMNAKAAEIGMTNSSFVTPSGLDAEEHYSTARDMATLAYYAMKNPKFAKVAATKSIRISYGNPPYERTLTNHNRLLRQYDGAIGIKTGFTKKSGRCLVTAAERDGVRLIAVTLNDPNDFKDHANLFDYGFTKSVYRTLDTGIWAKNLPVTGGEQEWAELYTEDVGIALTDEEFESIEREIILPRFVYAPVQKDETVGKILFSIEGKEIASVDIKTKIDINQVLPASITRTENNSGFYNWLSLLLSLK